MTNKIYLKCEQLLASYTKEYKYDEQVMRTIQIEIGSDAFLKMLLETWREMENGLG